MASIVDPSRSAFDLLAELNASDETPRIEAKRASEVGKSLMETLIAFTNEPGLGGGWLLLGVSAIENERGIRNIDQKASPIQINCRQT